MPGEEIIRTAIEYGSDAAWLLPVFSYAAWLKDREKGLFAPQADYIRSEPREDLPGANALLLMLKRYAPLAGETVSGYYLASQQSYEAACALIKNSRENGVPASMARVPLKEAAITAGLGTKLKNGLLAVPPYGTRFALQGVLLTLEEPPAFSPAPAPSVSCTDCGRCVRACPAGAIDEDGFH